MQGSATVVARSPVRPRAPRRAKRGPATRCDSARPSGDIPDHWRKRRVLCEASGLPQRGVARRVQERNNRIVRRKPVWIVTGVLIGIAMLASLAAGTVAYGQAREA